MSRHGKIARLPHALRDELNQRLLNGDSGPQLVAWLNARDDVRAVLAEHFAGRPITEDNLSEWRRGGYRDWREKQETQSLVRQFVDESGQVVATGSTSLAECLSTTAALGLGVCLRQVTSFDKPLDSADQKRILALSREVTRLRRSDLQQQTHALLLEKWQVAQTSLG